MNEYIEQEQIFHLHTTIACRTLWLGSGLFEKKIYVLLDSLS